MKVGHHGASNALDETFIKDHSFSVSLISTGKNNYGHPSPYTLDLLRDTDIYRTDRHNSIKISTNGENYRIYTFNSTSKQYDLNSSKTAE